MGGGGGYSVFLQANMILISRVLTIFISFRFPCLQEFCLQNLYSRESILKYMTCTHTLTVEPPASGPLGHWGQKKFSF